MTQRVKHFKQKKKRKKKTTFSPSPIICQLLGHCSLPSNKSRDTKFLLPSISLAGRHFNACALVGVCALGFTETLTSSVTAHPEPNTRLTVVFFGRLVVHGIQVDTVLSSCIENVFVQPVLPCGKRQMCVIYCTKPIKTYG